MTDKEKIVHDLALIYAQEKFHVYYQSLPRIGRAFLTGVNELAEFYEESVQVLANKVDEIMRAYMDDDGNPIIGD